MRLEITRRTDLALRALIVLHHAGERMKGGVLAERIGTSVPFIGQIMTPLVQAGWVESVPGPTGGYESVAEVSNVSVLHVIEAVEGPTNDGRCVLRGTPCPPREVCVLHVPWTRAREALLHELAATSVADLRLEGATA